MTLGRPQVLDQTEAIAAPLDFMTSIEAWNADTKNDWPSDNALGRERASALSANLKMTGNYPALLQLMKMLSLSGQCGAVEIGFFQRIGELIAR